MAGWCENAPKGLRSCTGVVVRRIEGEVRKDTSDVWMTAETDDEILGLLHSDARTTGVHPLIASSTSTSKKPSHLTRTPTLYNIFESSKGRSAYWPGTYIPLCYQQQCEAYNIRVLDV